MTRPGTRPRVVVADPDPALLERVRALLAAEFDVVATVVVPRTAFSIVASMHPDAVVLNLSLHSSSGLETAWRLSTLATPPQIVFLTAHEGNELVTPAEESGALGYVLIRHLASDLIPALRRALRGRRTFPVLSFL
jgi:DNA-binding NarL/FixJ family response regulator